MQIDAWLCSTESALPQADDASYASVGEEGVLAPVTLLPAYAASTRGRRGKLPADEQPQENCCH